MTTPSVSAPLRFRVARVHAWMPEVRSPAEWQSWSRGERTAGTVGEPPLLQMAPMLRRHAARLGRMACEVAYDALGELRDVPILFCSRYGEVQRSVDLLAALASTGEVSPTSFGLSVHNAINGVFSMARQETTNTLAISAGDESCAYGIVEACSLLNDGAARVLVVMADCPLPSVYASFADVEPLALAWACLIELAGSGALSPMTISLEWRDEPVDESPLHALSRDSKAATARDTPESGALSALRVLLGFDSEWTHRAGVRVWRWQRHA